MPEKKPRKRGAPKGNQNAKGHGAAAGNKRAVVTGEHERIFFDSLSDEEKTFLSSVNLDKTYILREELILLTVRERRMMQRISDITASTQKGMSIQRISSKETSQKRKGTTSTTTETTKDIEPAINIIQRLEDALTRIQTRKQMVVDQIHRIEYDTERLKIDKQRVGYEGLRVELGLGADQNTDDGVVIVNDLRPESSVERADNPETG